jgi:FkbH-like protein
MQTTELRSQIDHQLDTGKWTSAVAGLTQLWNQQPTSATAGFINSRFQRLHPHLSLRKCRVAFLRSFTIEPVLPLLTAAAFVSGIELELHIGDFNNLTQELLDESSRLYMFSADVVIVVVQLRDIAPDLWSGYADLTALDIKAAIERVTLEFETWISAFRSHSAANLIVHTLEEPVSPGRGVLDGQGTEGQQLAIQQINREIRRLAAAHAGVYTLDYDSLVARHGRAQWHDERKWLTVRLPIAAHNLVHLANEWLRYLHPLSGKICKVLVTDLDNTLWGGVLGEDGIEGIQLRPEHSGGAYLNLQRAMLDLFDRGILLAISSKNNETEALNLIENHSGMLLRTKHISATRINWNDKAQSLREIAAELNVGTDSLAFIDDNPIERERIRTEMPEVCVIDLPSDPFGYATSLRNAAVFERLSISNEDRERSGYYAGQRQRSELAKKTQSIEDFYRSLDQEVVIAPADESMFARVAQLTQKTNQFNLTTQRYTEQQIAQMAALPDWDVHTVRVKDRFGDNGLVGVAITRRKGSDYEIDSLLLSCRVIGRTVETALLSHLAASALVGGAEHLRGRYIPTKKNEPARDFYPKHNFRPISVGDGEAQWTLDLRQNHVGCPEWIRVIAPKGHSYREHACS